MHTYEGLYAADKAFLYSMLRGRCGLMLPSAGPLFYEHSHAQSGQPLPTQNQDGCFLLANPCNRRSSRCRTQDG